MFTWRAFICANCGGVLRGDALRCHHCGMEYERDEHDAESQRAEDDDMQGSLFGDGESPEVAA